MLERLEIRNFALIEHMSIDLSDGFTVISGETGAGKSIILGALGLLLGAKADGHAVRSDADSIEVSALISIPEGHPVLHWLDEQGIEPDESCVLVRRVIKPNGRGLMYIQSQAVTRQDLSVFGSFLFDIYGQHDHQSLLMKDRQRQVLDAFAGNASVLHSYSSLYRELEVLKKERKQLEEEIATAIREQDYLQFALNEIEHIHPKAGEDDQLAAEIKTISQAEHIHENLQLIKETLRGGGTSSGAVSLLYEATQAAHRAAKMDGRLEELAGRLESLHIEGEDIIQSLRDYLDSVEYSQEHLDTLQDRLASLQRLKKKYGPSLDDVLAYAVKAQSSLEKTGQGEETLQRLDKRIIDLTENLEVAADALHSSRVQAAVKLQDGIVSKLKQLGMPNVVFSITVEKQVLLLHGADSIDFLISANPGEPQKPVKDIASGGELSRVMLAIKTVLAQADDIQTMIFDEVDAGIGGSVAIAVGNQLSQLGASRQVLAITHLASIAAQATAQVVVSKQVQDGRTFTTIRPVSGAAREQEIARMLSGDDQNALSLSHAKDLLSRH